MTELIKSLEAMLTETVGESLAAKGFKRYGNQEFHKPYAWGTAAIHLSFIEHANDFDVTVDVAIRFDSLEELICRNDKALTAKEKKNMFSMGAELGNLSQGSQLRWTVSSETDVQNAATVIKEQIARTATPYIETYGDPNKAIEVLSSDDRNAWIHAPIHGERAKRAVGLVWLSGDKHKLKSLIESKAAFLRERKDYGLADFEEFARSLGE